MPTGKEIRDGLTAEAIEQAQEGYDFKNISSTEGKLEALENLKKSWDETFDKILNIKFTLCSWDMDKYLTPI